MKKLLSLTLSLALAFSLAVPACAVEAPVPPQLSAPDLVIANGDAWLAAHPDQAAAFDPHAYFAEKYYYYDSEEEYMETWELTLAEFEAEMKALWASDRARAEAAEAQWALLQTAEPAETAQFLAGFDAWFSENYGWYDSFDEYLDSEYMTQGQALSHLYGTWKAQQAEIAQANAQRDAFLTEHGGVPGQLNVMVDGTFLTFPADAKPYAADGATYVPAAALNAALGTSATADGDGYLPLRATAEAAGYAVEWDEKYNAAVLTEADALADALDRHFTVANALMAGPTDGKTHTADGKLAMDLTLFNSLDGDETYKVTGSYSSALSAQGGSFQLKLDLSGLAKLPGLADLYQSLAANSYPMDMDTAMALLGAVKDFSLEGYLALEEDSFQLYLRSPLFPILFPDRVKKGDWVKLDADERLTVGAFLADMVEADPWSATPAERWGESMDAAQLFIDLLGDGRFTPKGTGWDYKLDQKTVTEITQRFYQQTMAGSYYDPYAGMDWSQLFKTCKVDLHLEPSGAADGSFALRPNYGAVMDQVMPGMGSLFSVFFPALDFQMEGTYKHSGSRQTSELTCHYKNTLKLELTNTAQLGESSKAPQLRPADGDTVVDLSGF